MPVDPANRERYLEYLSDEHGGAPPIFKPQGPVARIPFQSPMLTWATTGGVPVGHICRWYGPEGSGKSLTNLGLIWAAQRYPEIITAQGEREIKYWEARRQKLKAVTAKKRMNRLVGLFPEGMETLIFDTEQRFDHNFAEQMGVNTKRVEIQNENVIELMLKDAIKAMEAFHIIIIDSASNAQSKDEAELDAEDNLMASAPRAWSRIKQLRKKFDRNQNTLIIVDQMRTQLGMLNHRGQAMVTPPGVRILRHNSSMSMEYSTGKYLYLDKHGVLTDDYKKASNDIVSLGTDGKEPHGIEMRCKVMKNSTGRPFRNARMRLKFPLMDPKTGELVQEVGYDRPFELLEIGMYFMLVEQSGSRYYPLDDNFKRIKKGKGKGELSWHGESQAFRAIEESEELTEKILTRLSHDM